MQRLGVVHVKLCEHRRDGPGVAVFLHERAPQRGSLDVADARRGEDTCCVVADEGQIDIVDVRGLVRKLSVGMSVSVHKGR